MRITGKRSAPRCRHPPHPLRMTGLLLVTAQFVDGAVLRRLVLIDHALRHHSNTMELPRRSTTHPPL